MANKLNAILLFLLLSVLREDTLIMRGEATTCERRSTLYRGLCWNSNNCGLICDKEGFSSGKCKFFKCVCLKDCGVAHAAHAPPNGGQPDKGPPSDETPVEGEPTEGPPSDEAPAEGPPSEEEPGESPPSDEAPAARGSPAKAHQAR